MKLLRIREVMEITGLSRMTIHRMEKAGAFPSRRRLGANSVAWFESDVNTWIQTRPPVPTPSCRPPAPSVATRGNPPKVPTIQEFNHARRPSSAPV